MGSNGFEVTLMSVLTSNHMEMLCVNVNRTLLLQYPSPSSRGLAGERPRYAAVQLNCNCRAAQDIHALSVSGKVPAPRLGAYC